MAGEGLGYALDDEHRTQTLEDLAYETVAQETPAVVGIGDVAVDHVVDRDTLEEQDDDLETRDWFPQAGESVVVDDVPDYVKEGDSELFPGGRSPNQSAAAALSGANTAFLGKSNGDDIVIDALAEYGVDTDHVRYDETKETSTSYVFTEADGENRIAFTRGANSQLDPAYIDGTGYEVLQEAEYVVLNNGDPDDTLHHVLDLLDGMDDGPDAVFDPAPADGAEQFLEYDSVTVVTPNETEYAALADDLEAYDGTTIITSAAGASIDDEYHVDAPDVAPVDTTGAGDTFAGYLAGCLSQGMEIDEAAEYAVHAASLSVTEHGAQDGIPAMDAVETFMDNR
jgi:ribokinase